VGSGAEAWGSGCTSAVRSWTSIAVTSGSKTIPAAAPGFGSASLRSRSDAPRVDDCSDGEREGFRDIGAYPDIAGCSGGFGVPGIHRSNPGIAPACGVFTYDTTLPACDRNAGDDSPNPDGSGCNVQDLCADGWHVCRDAWDVADNSPTGCEGATTLGDAPLFFASRQTSTGCGVCATGTRVDCDSMACAEDCAQTAATSNDFFGCGNFGATSPISGCGPLDRFSHDDCSGLAGSPWTCESRYCEAYTVRKLGAPYGGVLCCRDGLT
jgi:hypothetical protein